MMSCGSTLPRVARLSVRISVMVMTMVTSTTSVAPNPRASSRRRDEWNNIGAATSLTKRRIMDFELKTLDPAGAAREKCDALIMLVGENFKAGKADVLGKLAGDAV